MTFWRGTGVTACVTAAAVAVLILAMRHGVYARPVGYVASVDSGAVTELDTAAQSVAATIPLSLAFQREYARVSPNAKRLYVSGPDALSVIGMADKTEWQAREQRARLR